MTIAYLENLLVDHVSSRVLLLLHKISLVSVTTTLNPPPSLPFHAVMKLRISDNATAPNPNYATPLGPTSLSQTLSSALLSLHSKYAIKLIGNNEF